MFRPRLFGSLRKRAGALLFGLLILGAALCSRDPARASIRFSQGDLLAVDGVANTVTLLQMNQLEDGMPSQHLVSADPQFQHLSGVAIDANNHIYVSDVGTNSVYEVDPSTGNATPVISGLNQPTSLAIDKSGSHLLVTNSGAHTLLWYALPLSSGEAPISESGFLGSPGPFAVAVDPSDSSGLGIYTAEGDRIMKWVSPLTGTLSNARGVAIVGGQDGAHVLYSQTPNGATEASLVVMKSDGTGATTLGANAFLVGTTPSPTFLTGYGWAAIVSNGEYLYQLSGITPPAPPGGASTTLLANNFLSVAQTAVVPNDFATNPPTYTGGGNVLVQQDSGAYFYPWATNIEPNNNSVSFNVSLSSVDSTLSFDANPAIDGDGNLTFTPAAGAHGSALVQVTPQSGGVDGASSSFMITVNAPPVSNGPAASAFPENDGLKSFQRELPYDPEDGDLFIFVLGVPNPEAGTAFLGDGITPLYSGFPLYPEDVFDLQFLPAPDFTGDAGSLEYLLLDPDSGVTDVIVPVRVEGPQIVTHTSPWTFPAGGVDKPLNIPEPTHSNGAEMTVTFTSLPTSAQATITKADHTPITGDSVITPAELAGLLITPKPGFTGSTAPLTYTVADAENGHSSATLLLTIAGPVAQADVYVTVGQDSGMRSLNLTTPVESGDGPTIWSVRVIEAPSFSQGKVYYADGTTPVVEGDDLLNTNLVGLQFQPEPGFYGDAGKLRYVAEDSNGAQTEYRVFFRVDGAPQLSTSVSVHVAQNSALMPLGLQAPTDPEGHLQSAVTIGYLAPSTFGYLSLADGTVVEESTPLTVADLAGLRFTPATGLHGSDLLFLYSVDDEFSPPQSSTQAVFVLVEGAPVVDPDRTVTVLKDSAATALGITPPAQADDDPLDSASVTLNVTIQDVPNPSQGTVALNENALTTSSHLSLAELADLTFQPAAGYAGPAGKLQYTATNDTGGTAGQTITFFVDALPQVSGSTSLTVPQNSGYTSLGQETPVDPDGGAVTVKVTAVPDDTAGIVYRADKSALVAGNGLNVGDVSGLHFKPVAGFTGNPGSFTYTVTDAQGHTLSQTVEITVQGGGDLKITKSGAPASVVQFQTVTYTLTATNLGPAGATGVSVTDPLPTGFQVVSATTATGSAATASGTVTWTIGSLAANQSVTLTLVTRPTVAGNYTNTATITGAETDPVSGNNTASDSTRVLADTTPPTAAVQAVVSSGGTVYVPIRVRDAGSGVAQVQIMNLSTNCRLEWTGPSGLVSVPIGGTITVDPASADTTVRIVKLNSAQKATFELRVTDAAGNSVLADPVIANLEVKKARQITRTFNHLPDFEHFVTLQNGTPGFTSVKIWVNGKRVSATDLSNGQELRLDVKQWMRKGKNNSVRITATGSQGATAILLIGDSSLAGRTRVPAGLNVEFAP